MADDLIFTTNQTDEDVKRAIIDGFISVRDDEGHLLFRYHPFKHILEIQRRNKKAWFDLFELKNDMDYISTRNTSQSAMSAVQQAAIYGEQRSNG